ncbi:uncharacterized protein tnxba [Aulostomus maculatus]
MLFTLGLLLLLTPFPSSQTTTNEKRDVTGSNGTKPNAVFTLSKPKTSAALTKQTIRPTQKPVNQVVLPTSATKQKLTAVNPAETTKSKSSPAVIQTTLSTPASASGTKKDKPSVSVNQTVTKDKPGPTGVPNAQSPSTKTASASGAKTTKDKLQPSVNQTASVKSPSISDGKTAKDKTAPSVTQNVQSTSPDSATTSGTKTAKNKPTATVNQAVVAKSPSTKDVRNPKDKPAPTVVQTATAKASAADKDRASTQPIKVVLANDCESSITQEQELNVKPGTPLVMTHKISLLPAGCSGGCEAEMVALKGRVTRLEREMSLLKDKCPCSANCPNDCSGNGECEKGKCVCQQGFQGPDCSKCAPGADCSKRKVKVAVDTVALKVHKDGATVRESMQERTNKVQQTVFEKKDQSRGSETKETDTKSKTATNAKAGVAKTQAKVDDRKITIKTSTGTTRPTVGQVLLRHVGRKQEEARKGKTAVLTSKKVTNASKSYPKTNQLKDEPQINVTVSDMKKVNGTSRIVTILTKVTVTNKTRSGKESMEQSTLAEKNGTQSSGSKRMKKVKVDTLNVLTADDRSLDADQPGQGKVTQRSQYIVNTTILSTSNEARVLQNKTTSHSSTKRTSGSGLGSVKVVNISSYSFTVTWSAPQGMFRNFTVIRREPRAEGDEDEQEEFEEEFEFSSVKNTTEIQTHSESTNSTSGKAAGSRGKTETKRITMVVPGSVRSVEFSNLRANTRYVLYLYGSSAERRSKIHRVSATTGPEPATDMIFSNVTQSSLNVSWSKPKTTYTGFRVTYTNTVTGEARSVNIDFQQTHVVLSKLTAASSYLVTVTSTHGRAHSDALTSAITTVPAPPTHLQAINVTDTRAVLQWTPSLGKVDRFIISYESSKTPNVTVTVMLSGNSVEHQLKGLQRGTHYTVKVLSQKDSLQSRAISTSFTTANVFKASEVGARSALIVWKTFTVVYHSYRIIYQAAGEETREVILEPTVTEYKLTGLLPMSRYTVLVQGERDGHYISLVTTEFITGKLRFPYPTECSQELLNGALQSGEVDIYPQGKEGQAVRVYCDMETDGGGWTVFQRRLNGKTDFYRTWSEYKAGFGNLSDEFWLGNEMLHNLTSIGPVSLRVDLRSGNDTAYAHYANFSIDSEDRHYTLTLSGYTGTAGDSMKYHNGRPFSSRDKDPDSLGIHCARAYMGGWWYKNCYKTNLNGLYGINSNNQGVVWIDWKGKDSSIPFTEMKFRPSRFSPATHG